MRLLHTQNKTLEQFFDDNIPPYAVLSHRWSRNELTYEDIVGCSTFPSDKKIDGCCAQAAAEGINYIWIDTVCIDKSSSSELSESINSMFAWYQNSLVCYAYLSDVSSASFGAYARENSNFRQSEWFCRGWTLQELLAPKTVKFYTESWEYIGEKCEVIGSPLKVDLCELLQDITAVPKEVLNGSLSITEISIATRMRWAAHRRTTRKEDIAYSLLGIFGVNMPLLYGEGGNAFRRLQEEIIRMSDDDSLFSWGFGRPGDRGVRLRLLAKEPADFDGCDDIRVLSGIWPDGSLRNFPHYSMTNKGLLIERPLQRLPRPFDTVLMPLDCTIRSQDRILALPLIGNPTTDSQLRTGPGSKPMLVSAKLFDSIPMTRIYLRSSEWVMPRESTGICVKVDKFSDDSSLQVLEWYPTSCSGLSLGNGQSTGLVEVSDMLRFLSGDLQPVPSRDVMLRLRRGDNRAYLVQIVLSSRREYDFHHKRVAPNFRVIEERKDASLAEFILEQYSDRNPAPSEEWLPYSADGYLQLELEFDSHSTNWVLTFRVGYKLPSDLVIEQSNIHTYETPQLPSPGEGRLGFESIFETSDTLPMATQPSQLSTTLLRHQRQALWFMILRERRPDEKHVWRSVVGPNGFPIWVNDINGSSQESPPPIWRGGILADSMGMGKTLGMISLILSDKQARAGIAGIKSFNTGDRVQTPATLVIVPSPLMMNNWHNEIQHHVVPGELQCTFHHGRSRFRIDEEFRQPDVVLTTNATIASEFKRRDATETLFDYHWHRVIIDEAHVIRNPSSASSLAICSLSATSRWAVTGSPVPNDLRDLVGILKFLDFKPYHTLQSLEQNILQIDQSSATQAKPSRSLRYLCNAIMLRRSQEILGVMSPQLYNVDVMFSAHEREEYQVMLGEARGLLDATISGTHSSASLAAIQRLRIFCDLGLSSPFSRTVLPNPTAESGNSLTTRQTADIESFAGISVAPSRTSRGVICGICNQEIIVTGIDGDARVALLSAYCSACFRVYCSSCITLLDDQNATIVCPTLGTESCSLQDMSQSSFRDSLLRFLTASPAGRASSKVQALVGQIKSCLPEKSLVYSCWKASLVMVEEALNQASIEVVRVDGSIPLTERNSILRRFREEESITAILVTISTDLTYYDVEGVAHVHLLEPQWNSYVESKAISRICRLDQQHRITVRRYIVTGSAEEASVSNLESLRALL